MRNRVSNHPLSKTWMLHEGDAQGGCARHAMPWECSATYQMSFSDVGSWTMRLSSGDRPVFLPE